jgi:ABC-2 type transport system ATP-binding protein
VQGWRAAVHLMSGSAFAAVYVATGRLGAAITAHATYNVLAGAALERGASARGDEVEAPPAEAIEVEKRFGERPALRGVSLCLERGNVLGLVGENGAGKTTLITTLVGLRRPDSGTVRVCGGDPRRPQTRLAIGFTPQEAAFPPTLRVREVVDLVRQHFPDSVPAPELIERFALGSLAARQTGGLSVGERRRLSVALAFVGRPRVVFLDEPTVGLDLEARHAVRREVRRFVAEGGAVLLSSHELHELETLAARVAVLRRGRLVAEGSVSGIRRRAGLARVRFEAAELPELPPVHEHVNEGTSHTFLTEEPEALVSALVRSSVPFARLEVSSLRLEDAFGDLMRGDP